MALQLGHMYSYNWSYTHVHLYYQETLLNVLLQSVFFVQLLYFSSSFTRAFQNQMLLISIWNIDGSFHL